MAGASAATALQRVVEPIRDTASAPHSAPGWYVFFFLSGFPALLYQIVWQRSLFTLYGVNIESVTMVVTAFMLGLGLGGLLGGLISRRQDWPLLAIFGVVELSIAAYGVGSMRIFHWAANFTAGRPAVETGLVAFALVVLPTVLMGSTLPILVSYQVRVSHNVGTSVGALYAVNTLGSATACFCAGWFLMRWLGETKTVGVAALLNTIVGGSVLLWQFRVRRPGISENAEQSAGKTDSIDVATQLFPFSFGLALLAACISGFVSLGYEIIWYRLFSFTTGGEAKSFAFLLGSYLMGIGAGSLVINRLCQQITKPLAFIRFLVTAVFAANVLGFLIAPILFELVRHVSHLWTLIPIGIAAACLGSIFPLLCHVSISTSDQVGSRMSYVYLSNIIGSVLGSYLTGFVLMDILSLRQVSVVLAMVGIALGVILLPKTQLSRMRFVAVSFLALLLAFGFVQSSQILYHHMYEKMMMKGAYRSTTEFAAVVETRSGEITVTKDGTVYGGGIYDGRFNVSLVDDTNGIQRPFALSYFHPSPREILIIGLSSGSWAHVIASHPKVEKVEIVEINPGYLRLIRKVPAVSGLLTNPKVHIEIDDGRRWLVRNPDRKFDVVVMNTTYNWRSNASNLLSVEFLQLMRKHLNPGGAAIYNTTESPEVLATGVSVFPFAMRIGGFLVVSDSPLPLNADRWRDNLLHYTVNGKPVFDLSQPWDRKRLEDVMDMTTTMDRDTPYPYPLESAGHIRVRTEGARTITDDNMGTEWNR